MKQLTGMDTMFLNMEGPNTPMLLSTFDIYNVATVPNGHAGYDEVLDVFKKQSKNLPMLFKKLKKVPLRLDNPYWVDATDFNVEDHFFRITLPSPGTWHQLMDTVGRLMGRPMDMTAPLWEVYVIDGLNSIPDLASGSFAVLNRMHHAFADGATTVAIRNYTHTLAPSDSLDEGEGTLEDEASSPSLVKMLARSCGNATKQSIGVGRELIDGLSTFAKLAALNIKQGDKADKASQNPPMSILNQSFGRKRLADMRKFDFTAMRAMRALVPGSTINDLGLAIVSGGLRRYLKSIGALPEDTLTSTVPINLRAHGASGGGNVVSSMILPLYTNIEDPVERLERIHRASASLKEPLTMDANRRMMVMMMNLPAPVIGLPTRAMFSLMEKTGKAPSSTAISNVPAFREPRYLAGAKMTFIGGFGMLMPAAGTTHGITLYNDEFHISLATCPEVMTETDSYMGCIEESYEEYRTLALKKAAKAPPKVSRKLAKKPVKPRKK